jgi:hypothetical protein
MKDIQEYNVSCTYKCPNKNVEVTANLDDY